jgi:hypothetical protein
VSDTTTLTRLLLHKIEEQIERAEHLTALAPSEQIEWTPSPDALRVCDLLGHLLECMAGFCAALYAIHPDRLAHFNGLRELPVNHCCGKAEALGRMNDYRARIREGFACVSDEELSTRIPTVFVNEGEPLLRLVLNNLEHLINHKYQLFFYLKLLEIPVGTSDLYHLPKGVSPE